MNMLNEYFNNFNVITRKLQEYVTL